MGGSETTAWSEMRSDAGLTSPAYGHCLRWQFGSGLTSPAFSPPLLYEEGNLTNKPGMLPDVVSRLNPEE